MKIVKKNLYADVKNILEQARNTAVKAVNFSMVIAYWQIGNRIVEEEQGGNKKAAYGDLMIDELSKKLTQDFGKGFSSTNLRYFRQFYLFFPIHHAVSDELEKKPIRHAVRGELKDSKKGKIGHAVNDQSLNKKKSSSKAVLSQSHIPSIRNAVRPELSWTHYRLLLKVENKAARTYYMNECAEENWSTRTLERQINSLYFERILSSKNKKALITKTKKENNADKPNILDFVKDPYVLEFLQLNQNATLYEKELETELLNKLQLFLLELGKGFSFVARQKRISADGEHFFIDLVFYNYILKCFVLIDLKTGKLTHQNIGQMDLYVRYYEDEIKQKTDNPTIGLILCTEKNETIVKYSVLKESKQIFASKYKLILPTEKELIKELNAEMAQLKNKKR
jgi:predicted nuclease of restriction endonuclease-like (RecB) superfamily